jgi:DNA-binding transcriptional ArsR family regulator
MTTDHLSVTFAALADPTRRDILAHLMSGEATVSELAEPFEISMAAISKHLRVLERAGLITRSQEAQARPCRIQGAPLKRVDDWIENYRTAWERQLDRLHDYLKDVKSEELKAGEGQDTESRDEKARKKRRRKRGRGGK